MTAYIIIMAIIWALLVYFLFKNNRTATILYKINDAVYAYNLKSILNYDYDDIEGEGPDLVKYAMEQDPRIYEKVLFRFWDWGYKHVLPPEDYEKIKPFMN